MNIKWGTSLLHFELIRCESIRKHWGIIYLTKDGMVAALVFNNNYLGPSLYGIAHFKHYHTAKRWVEHNQAKIYQWSSLGVPYNKMSDREFDLIIGS